jgi:hypothetical protein
MAQRRSFVRVRDRCLILFTLLLISAVVGCSQNYEALDRQLESVGGVAGLKQECQGFVTVYGQSAGMKYLWKAEETNFPPAIASFHPQLIRIAWVYKTPVVRMVITNGPPERGVLVAVTTTNLPSSFRPVFGTNWVLRKVGEGVFEYHD